MYPIGLFKKINIVEMNKEQLNTIFHFFEKSCNRYVKWNVIQNCYCSKCGVRENVLIVLKFKKIRNEKLYFCISCYSELKKELGIYPKKDKNKKGVK